MVRIEDAYGSNEIGLQIVLRKCIYYREEVCTAPRVRFVVCRSCVRINPHAAAKNIFEKIKDLAARLFNLPAKEPGQVPPGQLPLSLF